MRKIKDYKNSKQFKILKILIISVFEAGKDIIKKGFWYFFAVPIVLYLVGVIVEKNFNIGNWDLEFKYILWVFYIAIINGIIVFSHLELTYGEEK
ncbi:hypothetical protein [Capnocytophaga canis]|uniref:hypothetical protein n=1 Tax=Capnocytophaga canis TaxID=1848903 RepID=UPI001562C747|nr:hypothetical protein [Capnocytophaga canis]